MKKNMAVAVIFLVAQEALAGGLSMGMPGAVKKKAQELKDKITASQTATLSGTVAGGRPIALAEITFKDCAGNSKSATTGSDGKYSMQDSGLSYPLMMRVSSGSAKFFGIIYTAGTNNIHPLTDMVLRIYYRSEKGIADLDTPFDNNFTSLCSLPSSASIAPLKTFATGILAPVLTRQSIDSTSYDPFTTSFAADGTGFDKALDETRISANASFSSFTITDLAANTELANLNPSLNNSAAPNPPSNLSAVSTSSNAVTLGWTLSASANAAGYQIYKNSVLVAVSTGSSYTDRNLSPSASYSYAVYAINWSGTASAQSATLQVTLLPILSVTKSGGGTGTVTSSPSGIDCGSTCSNGFAANSSVVLTATAAALSTFTGWTGSGCSGTGTCSVTMSTTQSVTATFTTTVLSSPSAVGFSSVNLSSLTLSWNSQSGSDGFTATASTSSNFTGSNDSSSSTANANATTLSIFSLNSNSTYYVRVGAIYTATTSYADSITTATLSDLVTAAGFSSVNSSSVSLNWSFAAGSANGFLVESSTASDFTSTVRSSQTIGTALTTLTISSLQSNSTYYFRIGSLNHVNRANYLLAGSTLTRSGTSSGNSLMSFFVTSAGNANGGDYGGLSGADNFCQQSATTAGFGSKTWRAFLSTAIMLDSSGTTVNAIDRIGSGPWYNYNGTQVAASTSALSANGITSNLNLTETGESVPSNEHDILTGSNINGTALTPHPTNSAANPPTCLNWTSSSDSAVGWVGHTNWDGGCDSGCTGNWSYAHETTGCSLTALNSNGGAGRLYCFATN